MSRSHKIGMIVSIIIFLALFVYDILKRDGTI